MRVTFVHKTKHYVLTSYGNGAAYNFGRIGCRNSIFLQGDDATQFGDEVRDLERANPHDSMDRIFDRLWETYVPITVESSRAL